MHASSLNRLRAGVLGANDGIISVAVILVTVVNAVTHENLLLVGLGAMLAGAMSMAVGEYISVSAQRDAEKASGRELTSAIQASVYSFISFLIGAAIPFAAAMFFESIVAIVIAVLFALILTAVISARIGKAPMVKPLLRNVLGGGIALAAGIVLNQLLT